MAWAIGHQYEEEEEMMDGVIDEEEEEKEEEEEVNFERQFFFSIVLFLLLLRLFSCENLKLNRRCIYQSICNVVEKSFGLNFEKERKKKQS